MPTKRPRRKPSASLTLAYGFLAVGLAKLSLLLPSTSSTLDRVAVVGSGGPVSTFGWGLASILYLIHEITSAMSMMAAAPTPEGKASGSDRNCKTSP